MRGQDTREQVLAAAERICAEQGVRAMTNRAVAAAAGQGNNSVVSYHFGTRANLVHALAARHAAAVEHRREQLCEEATGSTDLRTWVACLVRPVTDHLEALHAGGAATWYARFAAAVGAEPEVYDVLAREALNAPSLRTTLASMAACLPDLPQAVRAERGEMAQHVIVHTCAERERALATGAPTPRATWDECADGLVDAITGLWLAPTTRRG